MEVIYYLTSFTRGCFKRRLSHFSKLAELLQNEREWYIELMNAWAETMVNVWAELRICRFRFSNNWRSQSLMHLRMSDHSASGNRTTPDVLWSDSDFDLDFSSSDVPPSPKQPRARSINIQHWCSRCSRCRSVLTDAITFQDYKFPFT